MSSIRQPAMAGHFYPAEPAELETWLAAHITAPPVHWPVPQILLLPHAGYLYSGKLAAAGVSRLPAGIYQRLIILSPAHRMPVQGVALPGADCTGFATPLGEMPLDHAGIAALHDQPQVTQLALAHQQEHAIEVLLPMLRYRLGPLPVLPLVVGQMTPEALLELLLPLLDQHTLLVISSDLSHYLSYREAQAQDTLTLAQILALDASLQPEQACGHTAINMALLLSRKRMLLPALVGQHNSGDITGERTRVVGYASLSFID